MTNYDKSWKTTNRGSNLEFYFDSYDLYNTLNKHSKPELYDCFDKGDEFGCTINFENENIEHLKDFLEHLTEITELTSDDIYSITGSGSLEIWDVLTEIGYNIEEDEMEIEKIIQKNDK